MVEIDIHTRVTGRKGRRQNKQIIMNIHIRSVFLLIRNVTTWNMLLSKIAKADTVNQFGLIST